MKDAKRIAAKPLKPAMQARHMAVLTGMANHAHRHTVVSVSTGNRAPRHGWRHGRVASRACLRVLQHGCVALCTVVRPWPFQFTLSGLRLTSILPLFFLQFFLKAIFLIKTRRFSLEVQISHNISIIESKEANLPLSHLDLA